MVSSEKHEAFHLLFANMSPEQIAYELNRVWISQDFVMVAVNREIGMTVKQVLDLKEA